MNDGIKNIIDKLLTHEISKSDAQQQLLYLFRSESIIPETKEALNASVSAIYFSDSSDYKSYHYQVVRHLTGIDDISDTVIDKLYAELNPE